MAVGIIIVVINAALLLFYVYLIIQFVILPRLRPWVRRLALASKRARWRHRGGTSASVDCSPSGPVIDDPAANSRSVRLTCRRRPTVSLPVNKFKWLRGLWRGTAGSPHFADIASTTTSTALDTASSSCSNVIATLASKSTQAAATVTNVQTQ